MRNLTALIQFLANLSQNHDFDLGYVEPGLEDGIVILRSDDERFEILIDATRGEGMGWWKCSFTSYAYDVQVTKEAEGFENSTFDAFASACEDMEE